MSSGQAAVGAFRLAWRAIKRGWRAWRAFGKRRDVRIVCWALLMAMLVYMGFELVFDGQLPLWGDYFGWVLFSFLFVFYACAALIAFPGKGRQL